jgi:putative membrane protein insertion efficiency factor
MSGTMNRSRRREEAERTHSNGVHEPKGPERRASVLECGCALPLSPAPDNTAAAHVASSEISGSRGLSGPRSGLARCPQLILLGALRLYRLAISPVLTAVLGPLGLGCRFTPTCSRYALQAIQEHGAVQGTKLAARRLCRCHPWGGWGHDPVPAVRLEFQPSKSNR